MLQETPTKMFAKFVVLMSHLRGSRYVNLSYLQDDFQRGGVTFLPRYELATVHSWERRCKQWSKDGVGLGTGQHFGKD
jgi:hypothetical protein